MKSESVLNMDQAKRMKELEQEDMRRREAVFDLYGCSRISVLWRRVG